jgi:MYXO-CTERM domain-containing protein
MIGTARGACALMVCAGFCTSAWGDDLTPAPWRFGPDTTFQHWDFSSGPGGGAPDGPGVNLFNPYGVPMMTPSLGAAWQPFFSGRNDVWALGGGGSLNFDVPNDQVTALHQKELWLQITFFSQATTPPPGVVVASAFGLFTPLGAPVLTPLPNGWFHELTRWTLPLCPGQERVTIFPSLAGTQVFIDQVVIDTQCAPVPSPASGALLLGAAGLLGWRRRR